jgi:cytoskeletal protein RodZ
MEPELLTRDYQKPPPLKQRVADEAKKQYQKNKNVIEKLKSPKILTIIILVLILLVVFVAILVITSSKRNTPSFTQSNAPVISQTATPTSSPKLSETGIQIQEFNKQLDENQPYYLKLKQPIVDLDLSFKK